jgi:hypothetical protein
MDTLPAHIISLINKFTHESYLLYHYIEIGQESLKFTRNTTYCNYDIKTNINLTSINVNDFHIEDGWIIFLYNNDKSICWYTGSKIFLNDDTDNEDDFLIGDVIISLTHDANIKFKDYCQQIIRCGMCKQYHEVIWQENNIHFIDSIDNMDNIENLPNTYYHKRCLEMNKITCAGECGMISYNMNSFYSCDECDKKTSCFKCKCDRICYNCGRLSYKCKSKYLIVNDDKHYPNKLYCAKCYVECSTCHENIPKNNTSKCNKCNKTACDKCSLTTITRMKNKYYCRSCFLIEYQHTCNVCNILGITDKCLKCQKNICSKCTISAYKLTNGQYIQDSNDKYCINCTTTVPIIMVND